MGQGQEQAGQAGALIPASSIKTYTLAAHNLIEAAARFIVEQHARELPDLTRIIVLLPGLHAATPFSHALARAAGQPALLMPHLTTLPQLAGSIASARPVVPDSARQSLVYAALREKKWFSGTDLWALSAELLKLFDEITLHQLELPLSPEEFTKQLAQAYRAKINTPMQFEARLVHELCYAMHGVLEQRLDTASAYTLRLAQVAEQASLPLYAIGLAGLTPSEQAFFRHYAEHQPVHLLNAAPLEQVHSDALAQILSAAWGQHEEGLYQRAMQLRTDFPQSALAGKLRLFPAHTLEQQARAAETQIRLWLEEGKQTIAVIAQDRLAARRVRALLERAQILVEDETGWTLSTAAASSVVMRWLDLLSGDFFHQDLLDFLKSPLVFADWPQPQRKEAVYELEQLIRKKNLISRLNHYRAAAHEAEAACAEMLERLHQAQRLWPKRAQTLSAWLETLRQTLDALGITQALMEDLAGRQLMQTLNQAREELRDEKGKFQFKEWRRWLDQQLETATFRDTGIASPVVFTHLPATRLRRFDGVVLLGCDAEHLPARGTNGVFFNQSVRTQLGLPTLEESTRIQLDDLAGLLLVGNETLVTWQYMINGDENLISPWFNLLQTLHQLAYDNDLTDTCLASLTVKAAIAPEHPAPTTPLKQPLPTLATERVPTSISASGYNSLMSCPYQYYARHVLKLNDLDEVQVAMEKRDFGELIHRILLEFHRTNPVISNLAADAAQQALRDISDRTFEPMLKLNYLSHAWSISWGKLIPDYIAWQIEREKQGWRWEGGEVACRIDLSLGGGKTLTLRGTLDRMDIAQNKLAVIDYKTRKSDDLKQQLKEPGEDVQLPVYIQLAQRNVDEACYLSLNKDEIKTVALQGDLNQLGRDVAQRLADMFVALHDGAALPAQGRDKACEYCEMQGLCRRDYWSRTS